MEKPTVKTLELKPGMFFRSVFNRNGIWVMCLAVVPNLDNDSWDDPDLKYADVFYITMSGKIVRWSYSILRTFEVLL